MAHYIGKVPSGVWHVTQMAHSPGFSISSNLAREFAREVAMAASMGWITVIRPDGRRALKFWNITEAGLTAINRKDMYR